MNNDINCLKSQEKKESPPQFTIVNHRARKTLRLTFTEYCIADSIYHLSNNPKYKGWCCASKLYLADWLGISKFYVIKTYKKLYNDGLIEYPEKKVANDTRVRVTQKFYDIVIAQGKQKTIEGKQIATRGSTKFTSEGQQSLPYNNNNNNKININNNTKRKTVVVSNDFKPTTPGRNNTYVSYQTQNYGIIKLPNFLFKRFNKDTIVKRIKCLDKSSRKIDNFVGYVVDSLMKGYVPLEEAKEQEKEEHEARVKALRKKKAIEKGRKLFNKEFPHLDYDSVIYA